MPYFLQEYLDFFKELAANNHKEWFDANRKRYETFVKAPFNIFITDLIKEIQKLDSKVLVEPKHCITRINRDIRFSKDKTPYKLHMSAVISAGGKKDKSYPGMYVEASPEHFRIYGGAYELTTAQTSDLRKAIMSDLKLFKMLINDSEFIAAFGTVHGEKAKRLPAEFQKAAAIEPLIFNKNMYHYTALAPDIILSKYLLEEVMKHYHAALPLQRFLERAMFS
jgi:uncharacterized protein (TIGR02453 family)